MNSVEFAEAMNHLIVLGAYVSMTVSETINGEKSPDRNFKVNNIKSDHYGYSVVLLFYGPMLVPFNTRFIVSQQS